MLLRCWRESSQRNNIKGSKLLTNAFAHEYLQHRMTNGENRACKIHLKYTDLRVYNDFDPLLKYSWTTVDFVSHHITSGRKIMLIFTTLTQ